MSLSSGPEQARGNPEGELWPTFPRDRCQPKHEKVFHRKRLHCLFEIKYLGCTDSGRAQIVLGMKRQKAMGVYEKGKGTIHP